jgi:hypothetical protein
MATAGNPKRLILDVQVFKTGASAFVSVTRVFKFFAPFVARPVNPHDCYIRPKNLNIE